jgi:DNA-binding IclR family transcriptional regulator
VGPRIVAALPTQHPLNNFRREISSSLHRLRDGLGETVAVVLFIGKERVIIDVLQGRDPLSPYYTSWLKSPLHGSASGRLLLLSLSAEDRHELIGDGPYEPVTPYTVTDQKILAEELLRARARGYAVIRDESLIGITAIGACIMLGNQSMGCLVTASSRRISEDGADLIGQELANTAKLISHGAPSLRVLAHAIGLKDRA